MIVQCPECQTKYNLPDSKLSDSGTKVRCSRCTHTFTAYPEGAKPVVEPASAPQPEPKAVPTPAKAQPPREDTGLDDVFGAPSAQAASSGKGASAAKDASGAGFDEDDFLASLGDLSDLGKDPFGDKQKESDEISFSDDFLKEDAPARASRKRPAADADEDIFGGLGAEADLDALMGEKSAPRRKPADDLGLDDLDLDGAFAPNAGRERDTASKPDSGARDDLDLGEDLDWGGPTGKADEYDGGGQGSPDAASQEEVGDEDFEAALRDLSMDLGEERPISAQASAGRTQFMDQTEDMDDVWPTGETDFSTESRSASGSSGLDLSLDETESAGLGDFDRQPKARKKKSGAGKLLLFLLLFVLLLAGAGVAAIHYLGLWSSLPPWAQDLARTAGLPQTGGMAKPAEEQVRLLSLENIRQYTVQNEKAGQVFVIEGKVVNNFPGAKEFIRVQASLYDQSGNVVVSKDLSAGNTVSLFQLQIMSPQEIDAALSSDVGILSNNSDVQNGESVPFMAVFFNAPESVAEFGVKVIEAKDPVR